MARIGTCSSGQFSPDGKELIFLSNLTGSPQIWKVATTGGWPELLTALEDPIAGLRWSPDGRWVAFSVAPGGGMNTQIYLMRPDGSGMRRVTDGGKETNNLGDFTHDSRLLSYSSNRRNPRGMHAYLFDIASGRATAVREIAGVGGITDVSRDGTKAVLSILRSRGSNDLVMRSLVDGREVVLTPHEGPGNFSGGIFSPDGDWVYLTSDKDRDLRGFGRVRTTGGPIEILADRPDAEAGTFEITRDGTTALVSFNVAGRIELSYVDLKTGRVTPGPKPPAELVGGLQFSADGRLLALSSLGAAAPSDIWVFDRTAGRQWRVTRSPHAGVDLSAMVRPELIRFSAHDGVALSGWLYRPKDARGPGPVVLSFHGGPEGQEVPAFNSTYQALVERGIAVFAPNVRGSSGFGKKFVNLDNGPLRVNGVRDIEACVRQMVSSGVADPKRIGIMGGSYGGYMVMAGLTQYPNLFAAGANLFGVVNFETFFKHTEPWMAAISTVEYGDPATQSDMLRELSPIHRIDRVKAPTIVLHGANDTNVPVVEAEQVVENLKRRGIPVEYVLFPDEGHGWRKTPNRIRATVAIVRWFDRYLKAD